jgi:BlaI family penicillinase repressor
MVDSSSSTSGARLPSDAELRILRHLWGRGEQTVREVHDHLSSGWDVGYTTVLKLLQRLHKKGMVERRRQGRAHVYRAVVTRERTERRVVRDFLERTMEGSLSGLLQRALPEKRISPEELHELQRLLDEWGGGG